MEFRLVLAPYLIYVTASGALLYLSLQLLNYVFRLSPRSQMLLNAGVLLVPVFTYTYYLRHMAAGCDMVHSPGAIRICTLATRYSDLLAPLTIVLLGAHVAWRLWQKVSAPSTQGRQIIDSALSARVTLLLASLKSKEKTNTIIIDNRYPMAYVRGFLRPEIVVTSGLLELLGDEELRAVLAHELAHIGSGDHVYNLIFIMRDIAFFSPFAHLAYQSYTVQRELAADLAASQSCSRDELASAIIKVAKRSHTLFHFAWQNSYFSGTSSVSQRVRTLLAEHKPFSKMPVWPLLALMSTVVLILC